MNRYHQRQSAKAPSCNVPVSRPPHRTAGSSLSWCLCRAAPLRWKTHPHL